MMFHLKTKKDDAAIQADVVATLAGEAKVIADHIVITVQEGVVSLGGSVPNEDERAAVAAAVRRVTGVVDVIDDLNVDPMAKYTRTDAQLCVTVDAALKANPEVPGGVSFTVENGWVTLRGFAQANYQMRLTRALVMALVGVYGVTNDMTLESET